MLEKIGLPAKPSLRGNNWVVDASHCQGCSSQFTFINRKHHCRRCGGIFCNTCTQQRMVLRGQGDSPVRICDPCKKLEEAARFELRHGHRNRTGRGSSRTVSKNEDEILAQILASDTKGSSSSRGSAAIVVSSTGSSRSSMGSANSADSIGLVDESIQPQGESESADPKDLRQQALDEKKKYKILKGEGKNEEALKAFKRGKELERQADALEIFLRKSRKRVLPGGNMGQNLSADGSQSSRLKDKSQRSNDLGKDDLVSELRELGWSDMDLHNDDKKSKHITIEGELSALIGEMSQKSDVRRENQGIDRTQITAHKRKALLLKREGKLAEAKEELKKAKLLEKQAEEQELLAGVEDSDDEFSALISSMDDDKQDDLSIVQEHGHFHGALGIDDIDNLAESNFDVTEEDMEDPELASVLKSLGWDEESNHTNEKGPKSISFGGEALLSVMTPKKEDSSKTDAAKVSVLDSEPSPTPSTFTNAARKPRRSKAEIQRELLGLKRKALVLRREGKSEEAEEMLKMAKSLEDQIVELEAPKNNFVEHAKVEASETVPPLIISGEGNEVEVTEDDMYDPALLGMLNGLGWKDEEHGSPVKEDTRSSKTANISTPAVSQSEIHSTQVSVAAPRSKAKVQRELLGLKRKALELRRKGEMGEAEEVLSRAKALEKELEELEAPKELPLNVTAEKESGSLTSSTDHDNHDQDTYKVTEGSHMVDRFSGDDSRNPQVLHEKPKDTETSVFPPSHTNPSTHTVSSFPNKDLRRKDSGAIGKEETHAGHVRDTENSVEEAHQISHVSLKQEILDHKKRAVALKREGKIAEAREELKQAKLLEKSFEDNKPEPSVSLSPPSVPIMQEEKEKESPPLLRKPLASRERFKIQQESLKHKRQALKLRKEGRIQEAEAETELAKALEAQLEESASHDSNQMSDSMDDVIVEELLDPELLSALRAVGIANTNIASQSPEKPEPARANAGSSNSSNERHQLEEQIKAAKVKAVNLKRSGKQAEALDALRGAKLLEKKLNALESK